MLQRINLLPWREQQRAAHQRRFIGLTMLGVICALGIQWGIGLYLTDQALYQQSRLDYLNHYIQKLDTQINALKLTEQEHKALLTRLSVVESLQRQRNTTTQLMNLMPQLIPEGVYIDKLKMQGQKIEVMGIGDSTARLATMLDNLEKSPLLAKVEMHSIVHGKQRFGKAFQTFSLSFMFHAPTPNSRPPMEITNEGGQRG